MKGTLVMPEDLAGCQRNKNIPLVSVRDNTKPTNTEKSDKVYDTQTIPGSKTTTPGHVKATNGKGEVVEDRDIKTNDDYNATKKKYEGDSNYQKDC